MKKNFALTDPNHKPDRVAESVKAEVNKYVARERRKSLPKDVDYWDFDCAVGVDAASAKVVHIKEISKAIDEVSKQKMPSVYIEIHAKPGFRAKKSPRPRRDNNDEDN